MTLSKVSPHLILEVVRVMSLCYVWADSTPANFSQLAFTCWKLTIKTLEQRCEICSKLTIKTPKRRQWRRFGVFIVNFEHVSHLCSSVSIVNFGQVNASWNVKTKKGILKQRLWRHNFSPWRHQWNFITLLKLGLATRYSLKILL